MKVHLWTKQSRTSMIHAAGPFSASSLRVPLLIGFIVVSAYKAKIKSEWGFYSLKGEKSSRFIVFSCLLALKMTFKVAITSKTV